MEVLMGTACGLAMVVVLLSFLLSKWNEIRYRRKGLPPGTMGWPLVGETSEFLKLGPKFMKERKSRYGSLFKTHFLGSPTVVSMDPELNRYILMNESKGLVPGYPRSMVDLLGKLNVAAVQGLDHKRIRGSLLSMVNPAAVRQQLLHKIDNFIRVHLAGWDGKVVDIQEKTKLMALYVSYREIFGTESSTLFDAFRKEFDKLHTGTLSLPINIPGTNYHIGFQGRKNILNILRNILKERRANTSVTYDDLLSYMMEDSRYHLDEEIMDQVINIMYSGYETVSTTSMMAVKYLTEHPQILGELRDEHFAIRSRKGPMDSIEWDDYKEMRLTRAVIFETSRLATVINGVLRRTMQDVELKGYVIPKGWRIYVYTREINYDRILYPEPLAFNPYRWLVSDLITHCSHLSANTKMLTKNEVQKDNNSLESHRHLFLFGAGTRLCPGKELGIVLISIFLHYLVSMYRWEETGRHVLEKFPRVEAPNGLHYKISSY